MRPVWVDATKTKERRYLEEMKIGEKFYYGPELYRTIRNASAAINNKCCDSRKFVNQIVCNKLPLYCVVCQPRT